MRRKRQFPVIIISMNRLGCLLELLAWLKRANQKKVIIVDNGSTYQPLLNFYSATNYKLVRLRKPIHPRAIPSHRSVRPLIKNSHYVLTDPDVIPCETCPLDAVSFFSSVLKAYPSLVKVGFGLKIDDLPKHYKHKKTVVTWEQQFWENPIGRNLYSAPIDTTFALYRKGTIQHTFENCARTGGAYLARHLPWYTDSNALSTEEKYYRANSDKSINSWNQSKVPNYIQSWVDNAE